MGLGGFELPWSSRRFVIHRIHPKWHSLPLASKQEARSAKGSTQGERDAGKRVLRGYRNGFYIYSSRDSYGHHLAGGDQALLFTRKDLGSSFAREKAGFYFLVVISEGGGRNSFGVKLTPRVENHAFHKYSLIVSP